jgi:Flp pilus assembly protein TadG
MKLNNPSRSARRGSESIEAAITLPLLLLVIFAACEYGWLILKSSQIDAAARLGAREASFANASGGAVETRVQAALSELGIAGAQVSFSPAPPEDLEPGAAVTVVIEARYSSNQLLGLANLMPMPETLRGRAAMVIEPRP